MLAIGNLDGPAAWKEIKAAVEKQLDEEPGETVQQRLRVPRAIAAH